MMVNDPDDLNWRIARAVQPELYKALNHVSKLDHNHTRDMDIDRNRGGGTWWRAVKVADAVIAALPELQDDEPEHGNPFGDVEDYLGPLTVIRAFGYVEDYPGPLIIGPGVKRARVWDDGDPEAAREFWQDGRWS